jgi:tetratricopeptide (TPR) repeat protein
MTSMRILSYVPVAFGFLVILLVFAQVFRSSLGKGSHFLRVVTYLAFFLTVGGVGFGEYYASTAPKRFHAIEVSMPAVALAGYSEAISLNPSDAELYYRRGRTAYGLHKYADAIQDFTKALELSRNNPKYLISRASSFLLLGDDHSADDDIKRALGFHQQDPELNMINGILQERRGLLQDALKEYTAALSRSELGPANRCSTLFNRGNVYLQLKAYAEADQDYSRVIEGCNDPEQREDALVNRGGVRGFIGNRAGALADLEEALRLSPNDPVIFKNRAGEYIDEGRPQLALDDSNRYLQLRPDDGIAYMIRSTLYDKLGDRQRAQLDRDTAQELFRTNRSRSYGPPGVLPPIAERNEAQSARP